MRAVFPSPTSWQARIHRSVVLGQWVAYVIGLLTSIIQSDTSFSLGAAALAGLYVAGSTVVPEHWFLARFGNEGLNLSGAILVLLALTMSGGAASPYLLLSMGPPIFATIYGGFRAGLTTGLLAGSLLVMITLAAREDVLDAAPAFALYLLFVFLVGVIRRLLEDVHEQATQLAAEKATATLQLERLQTIHSALVKLSEDVSAGRLNAIEVGAETLERILEEHPGSSGKLAVHGEQGLVVLAARGIPEEDGHIYKLPLSTSDTDIGILELTAPAPLSSGELTNIAAGLHPVSVAFANVQLLQEIVGSAVAEERTRLAREMHDEIGPSLASLGLALDMAAMQQADRPEIAADLQVLRSNVTKLVEDVRASVADLRNAPGPTLTARVLQTTATIEEPPIIVDLDERRPPRPAQIGDLTSIITEAARNAHRHSKASKIVISGHVDRSYGTVSVVDDGVGFDPAFQPDGHYGLTGMRERADKIEAALKIESKPGVGSAVTVEWGTR